MKVRYLRDKTTKKSRIAFLFGKTENVPSPHGLAFTVQSSSSVLLLYILQVFSSIAVDMAREKLSRKENVLIASVADFFAKEKESGQPIDFKNVSLRTAKACKISVSSVLRCRQWAAKQHTTLKKARTKAGRPKVNIDEFTASVVRLVVQSFFMSVTTQL